MQTLGISDFTPESENRLKSLFWPSIQNATDVDYLGAQGYWICTAVAVISFAFLLFAAMPFSAFFTFILFYLGGIGVRERSRFASVIVFIMYALNIAFSPSVINIILSAVLLSNVRATWIAAGWKPETEEAILPPRLNETWPDKLADQLPAWLWPKVRIPYYVFSALMFLFITIGLTAKFATYVARH